MEQNFLKRRQNFHGSELIALTNEDLEYTKIENFNNAPYFPSNQTYDVTGLAQWSIIDN